MGLGLKDAWYLITGIALLVMAILAGFAFGYAYNEIFHVESASLTFSKLNSKQSLFMFSIVAWIAIIALDILVSIGLYQIYKGTNQRVAAIASGLRLLYTVILCIAVYVLSQPIIVNMDAAETLTMFNSFLSIWNGGLIIFGAHLVLLYVNCNKSNFTPKVVSVLLLIRGLSYIIVHGLQILLGNAIATAAESLLIIPMALSELVFAIWLIYRYVSLKKSNEHKSLEINT